MLTAVLYIIAQTQMWIVFIYFLNFYRFLYFDFLLRLRTSKKLSQYPQTNAVPHFTKSHYVRILIEAKWLTFTVTVHMNPFLMVAHNLEALLTWLYILKNGQQHTCMLEGNRLYTNVKLLKPTGHVMNQQFNIQQLYVLPTLYLRVLYLSEKKQRLVPFTA